MLLLVRCVFVHCALYMTAVQVWLCLCTWPLLLAVPVPIHILCVIIIIRSSPVVTSEGRRTVPVLIL